MSIHAMTRVLDDPRAQGTERLVLLVMANRAGGDDDVCFASVDRIAFECQISRRSVQYAIARAVESGDLELLGPHPRFRTNMYAVMPTGVQNLHGGADQRPDLAPKQKKQQWSSSSASSSNAVGKNADASVEKPNLQVSDRTPYFIARLAQADPKWSKVTIAACVRLAKRYGMESVTTALSFAATDPPTLTGSAHGWLEATAKGLYEAKTGAA